jgi:four helix bundle protein
MNPWAEEMKARVHQFMLDVIRFVQTIPDRTDTRRLKDQLIGAASGIDGNYHAACRSRTHDEFTALIGNVLIEADEAEEWLDTIHDAKISTTPELRRLRIESKELRAIFAKATLTANNNRRRRRRNDDDKRRRRNDGE